MLIPRKRSSDWSLCCFFEGTIEVDILTAVGWFCAPGGSLRSYESLLEKSRKEGWTLHVEYEVEERGEDPIPGVFLITLMCCSSDVASETGQEQTKTPDWRPFLDIDGEVGDITVAFVAVP